MLQGNLIFFPHNILKLLVNYVFFYLNISIYVVVE